MALMFPRLARNFIKNGYFPTDEETMGRILHAIAPTAGAMRIFDPCSGEGVALAECKAHLASVGHVVTAYGIEYEAERSRHAKTLLDRCIRGSFFDCMVTARAFGLLFLNPPYGDKVADKAGTGTAKAGKQRLETDFLQRALHHVQFGGVLVLIVPHYVLNTELADVIAKYFDQVQVFMAPEQQFKQAVVFGVRKRTSDPSGHSTVVRKHLHAIAGGELPAELPESRWENPYRVPAATDSELKFVCQNIDPEQLREEIERAPGLWTQFELQFGAISTVHRRPLRRLSEWHLALALAAGQVSGVITSLDGRVFVIKGDTHKEKSVSVQTEMDGDRVAEIRIATDRFIPIIRAFDFTPNSSTFGNTLVIR